MPHESDYESRVLTMCQEVHDSIIKKLTPAQKEYNSHLYIIVRNYLRKEDFHITDIERITNRREEEIYRMLLEVGFSRVDTRYWPNFKAVIWTRHFVEDFLKLLNYPLTKNSSFNYRRIENLISDPFRIADYRNVLIGVFESESLKSFSSDTIQAVKSTIQSASSGHCSYLFKQIVSILTDEFPEILMFTKAVEEEDSRQASSQEQVTEAEQTAIPVQELIEQNKKLTEELERARANADFLDLQFDTMQARYNEQKAKIEADAMLNLFKKMNSIENSNLLNSFSLAKASLDQLRETKWVAEPAVLDSILFFYDLFSDFLKRQDAKTKFTIGQVLDITLANIDEFEYSGSEITPETITTARVKMPAWYLGEKLVTKAKIVEIKKQK